MTQDIPQQRSYESVPTEVLEQALELNRWQYYNLLDQVAALQVARDAMRNVIVQRRHAERQTEGAA